MINDVDTKLSHSGLCNLFWWDDVVDRFLVHPQGPQTDRSTSTRFTQSFRICAKLHQHVGRS